VDYVLKESYFGENLRGWIKMLLNGAKTCIKANGFVSKYFPISCSCTQGYLIPPLIYILQIETMMCASRGIEILKV
jgi:hypothetical protein